MDSNQANKPEKAVSEQKLHPGSEKNDPQKEKLEKARSANTASQETGLNKSEHEDDVKASLNQNDINQNVVELEKGERFSDTSEDQARTDGPYGLQEEGYGVDSDDRAEK